MSEILMFSTHEMKYIWYLSKKSKFSFYFILFIGTCNVSKEVLKMHKQFFSKPK